MKRRKNSHWRRQRKQTFSSLKTGVKTTRILSRQCVVQRLTSRGKKVQGALFSIQEFISPRAPLPSHLSRKRNEIRGRGSGITKKENLVMNIKEVLTEKDVRYTEEAVATGRSTRLTTRLTTRRVQESVYLRDDERCFERTDTGRAAVRSKTREDFSKRKLDSTPVLLVLKDYSLLGLLSLDCPSSWSRSSCFLMSDSAVASKQSHDLKYSHEGTWAQHVQRRQQNGYSFSSTRDSKLPTKLHTTKSVPKFVVHKRLLLSSQQPISSSFIQAPFTTSYPSISTDYGYGVTLRILTKTLHTFRGTH